MAPVARICPHTKEGARCGLNRCVPDCPIRSQIEEEEAVKGAAMQAKSNGAHEWIAHNLWNVAQFAITLGAFAAVLYVANARAQDKAAAIEEKTHALKNTLREHSATADRTHAEFRADVERLNDRLSSVEWNGYVICLSLQRNDERIRCMPPQGADK